jgi:hypothetical protein
MLMNSLRFWVGAIALRQSSLGNSVTIVDTVCFGMRLALLGSKIENEPSPSDKLKLESQG